VHTNESSLQEDHDNPIKLGSTSGLLLATALWLAEPSHSDPLVEQDGAIAASGGSGVLAFVVCHGAPGEGIAAAGFPYLALQLQYFAQGMRQRPVMAPIAKGLQLEQI